MQGFNPQTFAGQQVSTATESVQQVQSGGMETTKTPGPIQYQNVFADLSNLASSTVKAYSAYDGAKQDEVYEKQQRELSQLGVTAAEEAWSPLTLAEKRQEILERHASEEALPKYERQQLNALDTNQANVGRLVTAKVAAEESAAAKARAAEMVENWTNQPDSVEVGFANDANVIPGGGAMTAPPGLVGDGGQGTVNRPNVMEGTLEEAVGAAAEYAIMVEYGPEWNDLNPDVQERIRKTYKTSFQAAIKARRDQLKQVERSANKTDADAAGDLNLASSEFADVSEMAGNPEGTNVVLSDDSWQETEAYIEAPGAGLSMAEKRARARTALKKITDGILADHSLTLEEKKKRIEAVQKDGRWGMYFSEEEQGLGVKETSQDFAKHVGESADSEADRLIEMHKAALTPQVAEDYRDRMLTQMGFSIDEPPSAGTPERQAFDKIIAATKRIKVAAGQAGQARARAQEGTDQIVTGLDGGRLDDPNKVPAAIPGLDAVLTGAGDQVPSDESYPKNAEVLKQAGITIASMPNANPGEMNDLTDWAKQSMSGTNPYAKREVALFVSTLLPHQRRQFLSKLSDWEAYQLRNATRIMHAKGGNLTTNDYFGDMAQPLTEEEFKDWTNSDPDGGIKLDEDANDDALDKFTKALKADAADDLQGTDSESWLGYLFHDDAEGSNLTAEKVASNPFLRDLFLKARAMSENNKKVDMSKAVEVLLGQMKRAGYTAIGDGENLHIVHDPQQHLDPTQMEHSTNTGSDKSDYLDRLTESQLARPVSDKRLANVAEAYDIEPEALAGTKDEGELLRRIALARMNKKFAAMSPEETRAIRRRQKIHEGFTGEALEAELDRYEGQPFQMDLEQIPSVQEWEFRSNLDQGDERFGRTAKYLKSPDGGLPRDFTFRFVDAPYVADDEAVDSASLFEGQHPPLLLSQKGQPLLGSLERRSGDTGELPPEGERLMDETRRSSEQNERDSEAPQNSFDVLNGILPDNGKRTAGVTSPATSGRGIAAGGTTSTDRTTGRQFPQ